VVHYTSSEFLYFLDIKCLYHTATSESKYMYSWAWLLRLRHSANIVPRYYLFLFTLLPLQKGRLTTTLITMTKNIKTVSTTDHKAVLQAAEKYVEILRVGNTSLSNEAFRPEATIYGIMNGNFWGGPISKLWDYIKQHGGPAPDIQASCDVLRITPTTAVVVVDMENDVTGVDYTDILTLIKEDGKWLISAKVFHAYEK
jgi:hypothetical protein